MNRITVLLVSALLLAGTLAAQESAPKEKVRTFTFTQDEPVTMMAPFGMMQREALPEGKIEFFSAEMAGAGEVVVSERTLAAAGHGAGFSIAPLPAAAVKPHGPPTRLYRVRPH